jgi:hypothetical protein
MGVASCGTGKITKDWMPILPRFAIVLTLQVPSPTHQQYLSGQWIHGCRPHVLFGTRFSPQADEFSPRLPMVTAFFHNNMAFTRVVARRTPALFTKSQHASIRIDDE